MNDREELIPEWLNLVKGILDTRDFPLNIPRESLQQNKILKTIKRNLVKKCHDMFSEIPKKEHKYGTLYEQFAKNLKLATREDNPDRTEIAELSRSYASKSGNDMVSLKEYTDRRKEGPKDIPRTPAESYVSNRKLFVLGRSSKAEFGRLYTVDPIDEYAVPQPKEFDGKKLVCCAKEGLNVDDPEEQKKKS